jgi:hypothetical protein
MKTNFYLKKKLQTYARAGNIIAVVGDIQELSFLEERHIEVIDTSNISDYTLIDFDNRNFSLHNPTVIWTNIYHAPSSYYSRKYIPCSDKDSHEKIASLVSELKKAGSFEFHSRIGDRFRYICNLKRSDLIALTAGTASILIAQLESSSMDSFCKEFFAPSEDDLITELYKRTRENKQ